MDSTPVIPIKGEVSLPKLCLTMSAGQLIFKGKDSKKAAKQALAFLPKDQEMFTLLAKGVGKCYEYWILLKEDVFGQIADDYGSSTGANFFEVIPLDWPVFLVLDLEYDKKLNPGKNLARMRSTAFGYIAKALQN